MSASDFAALLIVAAVLAWIVVSLRGHREVIFQYQRGLLFRRGVFQRVLEPGSYRLIRGQHTVERIDVRARLVTVPGQELLTADNVSIRITMVAGYRVEDPFRALHESEDYQEALYLLLQLHLRDMVSVLSIDDLLAQRREVGARVFEAAAPQAEALGLRLSTVGLKDVMFPGDLKMLFAQVVNARKEGLAALERARGETAALRSLANAARLLENNPALMRLRLLQSLDSQSGSTVIVLPALDDLRGLAASAGAPPPDTTG